MNLDAEEPDLSDFMDSLSVRTYPLPKRLPPELEDLTQTLDGIPTADSDFRVIDRDTFDVFFGIDSPRHIRVSLSTKEELGNAIKIGVAGLLLGVPTITFAVIAGEPIAQFTAIVGWFGLVVLSMFILRRQNRDGDGK